MSRANDRLRCVRTTQARSRSPERESSSPEVAPPPRRKVLAELALPRREQALGLGSVRRDRGTEAS